MWCDCVESKPLKNFDWIAQKLIWHIVCGFCMDLIWFKYAYDPAFFTNLWNVVVHSCRVKDDRGPLFLPAQGVSSADRICHRGCGSCRFGAVYCCFGHVGL